jgi:hypothetical protein
MRFVVLGAAVAALGAGSLGVRSAHGQVSPTLCPPSGVVTTFKVRDTDEGTTSGFVATHALEITATAEPPVGSEWLIDMDNVKVTPGVMTGIYADFTPSRPGPQVFTISWTQSRDVPDPAVPGALKEETCQGQESRTLQILPARRPRVGRPVRYAPPTTWMVGKSGLFEVPLHTYPRVGDLTPIVLTLRARKGTRIPLSGPASRLRLDFNSAPRAASMNGVRVVFDFGSFQVRTWRNPGPDNGLLIDITQGSLRLARIGVLLHCSDKVAASYACVYHLRSL